MTSLVKDLAGQDVQGEQKNDFSTLFVKLESQNNEDVIKAVEELESEGSEVLPQLFDEISKNRWKLLQALYRAEALEEDAQDYAGQLLKSENSKAVPYAAIYLASRDSEADAATIKALIDNLDSENKDIQALSVWLLTCHESGFIDWVSGGEGWGNEGLSLKQAHEELHKIVPLLIHYVDKPVAYMSTHARHPMESPNHQILFVLMTLFPPDISIFKSAGDKEVTSIQIQRVWTEIWEQYKKNPLETQKRLIDSTLRFYLEAIEEIGDEKSDDLTSAVEMIFKSSLHFWTGRRFGGFEDAQEWWKKIKRALQGRNL